MKIFVNKDIKHFFLAIMVVLVNFLVLTEVLIWVLYEKFSFWLLFLSLLTTFAILMVCFLYFRRQTKCWRMQCHRLILILEEMQMPVLNVMMRANYIDYSIR